MSVHTNPYDALARQIFERPRFRGPGFDWLSPRDMRDVNRAVRDLIITYDSTTSRTEETHDAH